MERYFSELPSELPPGDAGTTDPCPPDDDGDDSSYALELTTDPDPEEEFQFLPEEPSDESDSPQVSEHDDRILQIIRDAAQEPSEEDIEDFARFIDAHRHELPRDRIAISTIEPRITSPSELHENTLQDGLSADAPTWSSRNADRLEEAPTSHQSDNTAENGVSPLGQPEEVENNPQVPTSNDTETGEGSVESHENEDRAEADAVNVDIVSHIDRVLEEEGYQPYQVPNDDVLDEITDDALRRGEPEEEDTWSEVRTHTVEEPITVAGLLQVWDQTGDDRRLEEIIRATAGNDPRSTTRVVLRNAMAAELRRANLAHMRASDFWNYISHRSDVSGETEEAAWLRIQAIARHINSIGHQFTLNEGLAAEGDRPYQPPSNELQRLISDYPPIGSALQIVLTVMVDAANELYNVAHNRWQNALAINHAPAVLWDLWLRVEEADLRRTQSTAALNTLQDGDIGHVEMVQQLWGDLGHWVPINPFRIRTADNPPGDSETS